MWLHSKAVCHGDCESTMECRILFGDLFGKPLCRQDRLFDLSMHQVCRFSEGLCFSTLLDNAICLLLELFALVLMPAFGLNCTHRLLMGANVLIQFGTVLACCDLCEVLSERDMDVSPSDQTLINLL